MVQKVLSLELRAVDLLFTFIYFWSAAQLLLLSQETNTWIPRHQLPRATAPGPHAACCISTPASSGMHQRSSKRRQPSSLRALVIADRGPLPEDAVVHDVAYDANEDLDDVARLRVGERGQVRRDLSTGALWRLARRHLRQLEKAAGQHAVGDVGVVRVDELARVALKEAFNARNSSPNCFAKEINFAVCLLPVGRMPPTASRSSSPNAFTTPCMSVVSRKFMALDWACRPERNASANDGGFEKTACMGSAAATSNASRLVVTIAFERVCNNNCSLATGLPQD